MVKYSNVGDSLPIEYAKDKFIEHEKPKKLNDIKKNE